jgi:hypothetical protein
MGNYGLKVTKPYLGCTSTNSNDYVIWSKYKHFKITRRISGKINIANGDSSNTGAITHGLLYEPAFLSYFKYPNQDYWWLVGSDQGTTSSYFDKEYDSDCRPDKEIFNLEVSRGGDTSGSQDFPYVIYMSSETGAMGYKGNGRPPGYKTSDYGIKVSQKGIDATTKNLYEMQINSNCDHLVYHKTFTGSLAYDNSSGGSDTDLIAHQLSYSPVFVAYMQTSIGSSYYRAAPCGKAPAPFIMSAACNEQNILVEIVWAAAGNGSVSGTINYRVVVFKNPLIG